MQLKEEEIQSLVQEVIKRLETVSPAVLKNSLPSDSGDQSVIQPTIDSAVREAKKAQTIFQGMGIELRKKVIDAIRKAGYENAALLAKMAEEETGLGRWQDKVKKNILVSLKTPGVEDLQPVKAYTGDQGLTLIEHAPLGIVASITPSTNPTSTIINNVISILSAGNSVIFSPHPSARKCCQETMKILDQAILNAGGPKGLITTIDPPSQETTVALLKHPEINCALVTGGPSIVKIALSVGAIRKTICAGPGNPPVIIDDTADLKSAAKGIVDGASFDNCVLCTGEKEVIVVESVASALYKELRNDSRVYELSSSQMDELAKIVFQTNEKAENILNRDYVGKNANKIASALGLELSDSIRLLWGEVPNDHAFIWTEQLMPVLPITLVANIDKAIELAKEVEGGNHHTASIYSLHVGNITKAARGLACSIFVKNGPNFMGLGMGEGFATMSIGTPTGDGLTKPSHFSRPLHCSMVGYLRIV
ncbi:MAG: aldehyde dehydrogenase [Elusimicrobia bacterium]|nr:aldehyde dehydrogenase [Elusimicrobiota bacterium]